MAARFRAGRGTALHPAGGDAGRGAGGDPDAHGTRGDAGGTLQRLRAHRACKRPADIDSACAARAAQRTHSHHHHYRTAVRDATGGGDCHGNHFFLAGYRAPDRTSHLRARLSAVAGLHSGYCAFLCARQLVDGFSLFPNRSAGAAVMKSGGPLRTFLRESLLARIGFAIVCLLVVLALLAPWISPAKPAAQNLAVRLQGPSFSHWMGTDELGRDILTRVFYGARVSLFVSICVVLGCGSIGLTLGLLAGYSGGVFDRIVNLLLINAFLSFPGVLLAIAFAAFFGPGMGKVILALIITGWAGYARLARAQALKTKELEFVLAARSLGASPLRIMIRHLLPNMIQPVLVQATIGMAGAILAEATLSFLGLGVLAPIPSWGAMLNDARNHLFDAPHMVVFPALAVVLAVLAFNLLGDAWRDWLDPRTRSQMAAVEQSR